MRENEHPAGVLAGLIQAIDRLEPHLRLALSRSPAVAEMDTAPDVLRGLHFGPEQARHALERRLLSEPVGALLPMPMLGGLDARLDWLVEAFSLSEPERAVLLFALAAELDERYRRLFSLIQDDATRGRPTVGLLADLIATDGETRLEFVTALAGEGRLSRLGLITPEDTSTTMARRMIALDPQVANFLLRTEALDAMLARFARFDRVPAPPWALNDPVTAAILATGLPARLDIVRAPMPDALAIARAVAVRRGERLLVVNVPAMVGAPDPVRATDRLLRQAWLSEATLLLDAPSAFDTLSPGLIEAIDVRLGALPSSCLVAHPDWHPQAIRIGVADHVLSRGEPARSAIAWREAAEAQGVQLCQEDIAALVSTLRLMPSEIAAAMASAEVRDRSREALSRAARRNGGRSLDRLARRIEPRGGFERLIVPPAVREALDGLLLLARNRHRLGALGMPEGQPGVVALFAGPSGTGKSLAAEVLAHEMGLDLFRAETSTLVDKYIGETEKNLEALFAAAEDAQAVLLFDEADALFGKRSEVTDARDRYANQEVAYLLQRLERFDGLAILSTNLVGGIDDAFRRRIEPVFFPFPGPEERLALWQLAFPGAAGLSVAVDLADIAQRHVLSGGHIHAAARRAALIALDAGRDVTLADIEAGVSREFVRLGQPVLT